MGKGGAGALFRAAPLPTRTHPGPRPRGGPAAGWAALRGFVAIASATRDPRSSPARDRLVAAVPAEPPDCLTGAGAALLYADLIAAPHGRGAGTFDAAVAGLADWLLDRQGGRALAAAVDRVRVMAPGDPPANEVRIWSEPFFLAARCALVRATEARYAEASAAFAEIADTGGWPAAALAAFVLADDRAEAHALQPLAVLRAAEAAGASLADAPALVPLLAESPPDLVADRRVQRRGSFSFRRAAMGPARLAATLAAVAARNGQAALPALCWLLHHAGDADRATIARAVLATRQDGAVDPLLPVLHRSWARAALARAEACDPAWTVGRYAAAVSEGRGGPVLRARLQGCVARHGAAAVLAWAKVAAPAGLEALLAPAPVALAPRDTWPAFLRDPPWRDPARSVPVRHIVSVATLATPLSFDAEPEVPAGRGLGSSQARASSLAGVIAMVEAGLAPVSDHPRAIPAPIAPVPVEAGDAAVLSWFVARLDQLDAAKAYPWSADPYEALFDGLARQPAELALRLWRRGGPPLALVPWRRGAARPMLRRFGREILPELVGLIAENPSTGFDQFPDLGAGEVAAVAAQALARRRMAREGALAWLRRHRAVALIHLVPRAVGPAGREREEAGAAIRRLQAEPDGPHALAEVLSRYAEAGFDLGDVMAEVLAGDELALAPDRIRPLPRWFDPAALARPELRGGGALPDEAVLALGEVLSLSTPDQVHAGVAEIRTACTAASLGRFAADLLAAWLAAGMPGQQGWAIWAVGWLGDDESVAPLAAALQRFAACRALPQVAMAIQALTDLGSDAAVTRLGLLTGRLGAKSMRDKARRHLEAMARSRGLTRQDLEDRTAPDLDLDAEGGLDLDFGPRRFRIVFDEALVPRVRDEAGRVAATLPKPRRSDDAARAAAAAARWRGLKREARTAAGAVLSRLDAMVATGRRVSPETFLACFARHPFVGQAARRLVWGVFDGAEPDRSPALTFRLEGAAPVGADGAPRPEALSDPAGRIGLVHPLQLLPPVLAAWRETFARHGIAQPCPQLHRSVHHLSAAELAKADLYRFHGIAVDPGWLRGMAGRGWSFSSPVENGLMWSIERDVVLRDGRVGLASLDFAPGLPVGRPTAGDAPRALDRLRLSLHVARDEETPVAFDQLDRVTASEILRGLHDLAGHGDHPVPAGAAEVAGATRVPFLQ